ncbi:MAG: NlpC/P60 family protein [Veillonellales bacterium]
MNKWILYTLTIILLCGSNLYLPGQAQASSFWSIGSTGYEVTIIQQKLAEAGFYKGPVTGIFDAITSNAVKTFEKSSGVIADGIVTTAILDLINNNTEEIYIVHPGDTAYTIAERLDMTAYDILRDNDLENPHALLKPGTVLHLKRSATGTNGTGSALINFASNFIGTPYVWAGNSPGGFDCSGFIYYIFIEHGVSLPRMADAQFNEGASVEKAALLPGDLVFFETYEPGPSHVGIYLGDDKFIHASSAAGQVIISDLNKPYYAMTYLGARRVL